MKLHLLVFFAKLRDFESEQSFRKLHVVITEYNIYFFIYINVYNTWVLNFPLIILYDFLTYAFLIKFLEYTVK